jgi:uncharacterized membrane protein
MMPSKSDNRMIINPIQNIDIAKKSSILKYLDLSIAIAISLVWIFLFITDLFPLVQSFLSLVVILFIPGYLFLMTFFPNNFELPIMQKILGSFGLSVVITFFIQLLGMVFFGDFSTTSPWLQVAIILCLGCISFVRRQSRTASSTVYSLNLAQQNEIPLTCVFLVIFKIILLFSLIILASRLIFIATQLTPEFTEFYVVNNQDELGAYPKTVSADNKLNGVNLGVVNHSSNEVSYTLFYRVGDSEKKLIDTFLIFPLYEHLIPLNLQLPDFENLGRITFELCPAQKPQECLMVYLWIEGHQ